MIDVTSFPRVRSGYMQAALVFAAAALVNAPKWFEFRYTYIPDNTSHLLANAEGTDGADQEIEGKLKYKMLGKWIVLTPNPVYTVNYVSSCFDWGR